MLLHLGKVSMAGALAVAVVATATPANAAAKPHTVKAASLSCAWEGLIKTDIGNYLNESSTSSGEPVYTSSTAKTTWCEQTASEGGYYLLPVDQDGSLCLDGGSQDVGAVVQLYYCNGTMDQRWAWSGAGYLVRENIASVAAKDNGSGNWVTLASGNASKFYKD